MEGICPTCGARFEKHSGRHTFCTKACRTDIHQQWVELTCEWCGKRYRKHPYDLVSRKGGQPASFGRFCSRYCFHDAERGVERGPYKPLQERACPVCSAVFAVGGRTARPRDQTFCSRRCMGLAAHRSGVRARVLRLEDACYLAGFIDGEGSLMLYARAGGVFLKLQATNTWRATLLWIGEVTGVGKVHRHRPQDERHKATWQWVCVSDAAASVIEQIRPYLQIKAEQADLAIAMHERLRDPSQRADRSWQDEWRQRMQDMNRRGPNPDLTIAAGG